ncbi:hypothetical protein [Pseudorhodoferax soli]|uniref:DUF4175 domain-containing protein n=1 Tax=Pseudorhodoferax soli TaxID=545864 RepID=A0A368XZ06_9BURK|nr:hypothetical protein [Pseudorhodoferax soli]RCW71244.1 hypothetical protein DES41_10463 [Pseudorhodoferax soli]
MRPSFWRLWGWPLAIGLASGTGLVTALLADGWADAWSWVGLGLPLAVAAWHGWRPAKDSPP